MFCYTPLPQIEIFYGFRDIYVEPAYDLPLNYTYTGARFCVNAYYCNYYYYYYCYNYSRAPVGSRFIVLIELMRCKCLCRARGLMHHSGEPTFNKFEIPRPDLYPPPSRSHAPARPLGPVHWSCWSSSAASTVADPTAGSFGNRLRINYPTGPGPAGDNGNPMGPYSRSMTNDYWLAPSHRPGAPTCTQCHARKRTIFYAYASSPSAVMYIATRWIPFLGHSFTDLPNSARLSTIVHHDRNIASCTSVTSCSGAQRLLSYSTVRDCAGHRWWSRRPLTSNILIPWTWCFCTESLMKTKTTTPCATYWLTARLGEYIAYACNYRFQQTFNPTFREQPRLPGQNSVYMTVRHGRWFLWTDYEPRGCWIMCSIGTFNTNIGTHVRNVYFICYKKCMFYEHQTVFPVLCRYLHGRCLDDIFLLLRPSDVCLRASYLHGQPVLRQTFGRIRTSRRKTIAGRAIHVVFEKTTYPPRHGDRINGILCEKDVHNG